MTRTLSTHSPDGNRTLSAPALNGLEFPLLNHLLDSVHDAIFAVNPESHLFMYANAKACKDLGYSRQELSALKWEQVLDIPDSSQWEQLTAAGNINDSFSAAGLFRRKDASSFPSTITVKFLANNGGHLMTIVARESDTQKSIVEELEKEKAQTAALLEGTRAVLKNDTFEKTARSIFDACKKITGATAGYVALLSDTGEENEVLFLDAGGMSCTVDTSLPMPIRGLKSEAYKSGRAVCDNDFMKSKWLAFMPKGHVTLKNVMFAPLCIEGKTVGIMGLANKATDFTDEDIRAASAFGEIAAVALQNSRSQVAVEQSNKYWHETFNAITDTVAIISTDHAILDMNEAGCNALGKSRKEIRGRKCYELVHSLPHPITECPCVKVMESGKPSGTVYEENGRYYNLTAWPIFGDDGECIAFTHIMQDITEKRKADDDLRNSESMLQKSQEIGHIGSFEMDLGTGDVTWSDQLYKVFGLEKKGKTIDYEKVLSLIHPDDRERAIKVSGDAAKEGKAYELEHRVIHPDGSVHDLLIKGDTIRNEKNEPIKIIGTTQDITKMKRAEKEKQELHEQLRQAKKLEAIGLLAGGIAHDFNNILGSVLGNADLLREAMAPDDPRRKFSQRIFKSAEKGAKLVDQMLTFSRKRRMHIENLEMHEALDKIVDLLSHSLDKKIRITLHKKAQNTVVKADSVEIESALLNLALNARDAMPRGGELTFKTHEVIVSEEKCRKKPFDVVPGSYLQISVSDTGEGMDEVTLEHLFEPFFTTKEVGKGTGLGLASVYGCIKQHDGFIEVSSKPGKGTTFLLSLPLADGESSVTVEQSLPVEKSYKGNILVVDDEEYMAELVSDMLTPNGFTVKMCLSAREALDYFREHHTEIDLVILDIIMPDIDGYECFFELRKINATVPVIISSGYSCKGKGEKLLDNGAQAFLKKPFKAGELMQVLTDVLQKKESRSENE